MRIVAIAVITGAILLSTGCASIVDGRSQSVSFASNPSDAIVTLNGVQLGKTPVTVVLPRKSGSQSLKFSKEGFDDSEIQATTTMNPWFLGNIIFGGLYGSTTDGLSGAAYQYSPGSYMVTLQSSDTTPLPGNVSLSDKQKIVNFIIMGYPRIVSELVSTPGEYTNSLFEMASISAEKRPDALKKMRALSDLYNVIPEFAEKSSEILLSM